MDKGYTTHTCIRGDHEYIDSYIDELDHDYKDVVTTPSCTEQGYTEHTCTRCDEKYTDTYVSPGGHTYGDWEISVQPTETEKGTKSSSCTACGHTITESIPKLEVSGNPTDTPIITPGVDDEGDTPAIAITVIIVIAAAAVIGIGMVVSIFAKKKRQG